MESISATCTSRLEGAANEAYCIFRPPRITALFRSLAVSQVSLRDSRPISLLISLFGRA
jgi:hypothetical protein